ncbi:unnamed protein product [Meloidogyne enterolobii]|uniref:Uncharacterized protein n=1 Tax=Meloidogyne enterolobii TaxID=390850 RepID=A0ACB0ZBG6_MELEN
MCRIEGILDGLSKYIYCLSDRNRIIRKKKKIKSFLNNIYRDKALVNKKKWH